MAESEYYRVTMEGLNNNYGRNDFIRISDFIKNNDLDRRTVEKIIADLKVPVISNHYINKHALAQAMSKVNGKK